MTTLCVCAYNRIKINITDKIARADLSLKGTDKEGPFIPQYWAINSHDVREKGTIKLLILKFRFLKA